MAYGLYLCDSLAFCGWIFLNSDLFGIGALVKDFDTDRVAGRDCTPGEG